MLQKIDWRPRHKNCPLPRWRYISPTFKAIHVELKPWTEKLFYYPILVFYAESDSVKNAYQGKSPLKKKYVFTIAFQAFGTVSKIHLRGLKKEIRVEN